MPTLTVEILGSTILFDPTVAGVGDVDVPLIIDRDTSGDTNCPRDTCACLEFVQASAFFFPGKSYFAVSNCHCPDWWIIFSPCRSLDPLQFLTLTQRVSDDQFAAIAKGRGCLSQSNATCNHWVGKELSFDRDHRHGKIRTGYIKRY